MQSILTMPTGIRARFLPECPLVSREYEILKNPLVRESQTGRSIVEILCDDADARLLLEGATDSYSDAVAYIQNALKLLSAS